MLVDLFQQIYYANIGCVKLIKEGGSSNVLVAMWVNQNLSLQMSQGYKIETEGQPITNSHLSFKYSQS